MRPQYCFVFVLSILVGWTFHFPDAIAADGACQAARDPGWCKQRLTWYNAELPKAQNGDYIAQREISFCLTSGCSGAVTVDVVEACAWQNIIAIGKRGDATDEHNLRNICSGLTDQQKNDALTRAQKMLASMPKQALVSPVRQAPAIGN